MKFFEVLDDLKKKYKENCIIRSNGTLLLCINDVPKSRHELFEPLKDEYINEFLLSEYKKEFPKEYVKFLKYSNGAILYTVRIQTERFQFAYPLFIVFGLPLTSPFDRETDMEEPFDVRVEDLARHKDIPESWLKCGSYTRNYDFNITYDIFIDTITDKVYSVKKNEKDIIDNWDNLDECFCNIFESFKDSKFGYSVIKKNGRYQSVQINHQSYQSGDGSMIDS